MNSLKRTIECWFYRHMPGSGVLILHNKHDLTLNELMVQFVMDNGEKIESVVQNIEPSATAEINYNQKQSDKNASLNYVVVKDEANQIKFTRNLNRLAVEENQ